ncbi:hypothetical protein GHT06_010124 [Daphnia sinensis]|uniref:Uncharacterized protein n=1 Tax=Daphnia sinensis TaxID=1820382 RepID=A0AAD5LII4_9CRUS|nr:hypothetical protein GHT06_010124 [Daphnia sinensis]
MKLNVNCIIAILMVITLTSIHANSIAARSIDGPIPRAEIATTSTTRDWAQVCLDLCKTGDGGVLCNCELVPIRRQSHLR